MKRCNQGNELVDFGVSKLKLEFLKLRPLNISKFTTSENRVNMRHLSNYYTLSLRQRFSLPHSG